MTSLHEKSTRKRIFSLILIALVITSTIVNVGIIAIDDINQNRDDNVISPVSSAPVDEPWAGYGSNQSVYSYINNMSSVLNQEDNFNITVPTSPSKIFSADINLTLEKNYNTSYVIEDDTPLYTPISVNDSRDSISFKDEFVLEVGSTQAGVVSYVNDATVDTDYVIDSATNEINFTYTANFTEVANFDRNNVLGLKYIFDKEISLAPNDNNVSIQIYKYNDVTGLWDQLDDTVGVWSKTRGIVTYTTINTRHQYFNNEDQTKLKVRMNETAAFDVGIYDIRVEALYAIEKNISATKWVALEFDLKGNSTVYGINTWIRSLSRDSVPNANLTVSLYRANETSTRNTAGVLSPSTIVMAPNYTQLITSFNITGYVEDKETYFNFTNDFSGFDLNVSNYFVVFSSNVTNAQYSIVTLPSNDDVDGINHLFLHSTDSGANWEKEFQYLQSYQVDASLFSINITRGWMPEEIDLNIDDKPVSNRMISTGIYEQTSGYTWGLGTWSNDFADPIEDVLGNITIDLVWDTNYTSHLVFDSYYDVTAISMEEAVSYYNISVEEKPLWLLNYTLDQAKYSNDWSVEKFGYQIPLDWTANNLFDPSSTSIWVNASEGIGDKDYTNAVWINYEDTIQYSGNGNYSLNCSGLNYVYNMTAKINFNETLWETNAIMQGDNITVALNVFNYTAFTSEITSGIGGVTLYDIDGEVLSYINQDNSVDGTHAFEIYETELLLSIYDFDNENILNSTIANEKGEYTLVFNWTNGNEVGFRKQSLFITDYSTSIYDVYADLEENVNVLQATVNHNETDQKFMDLAVFSINETTDTGYNPPENMIDLDLNILFNDDGVNVTKLTLNESLINPGEKMKLNITIKSTNDWISNDVKVGIQFVQLINTNWIAMEMNSSEVELNKTGAINSEITLEYEFDVPADYKGVNAPIRINPFIVLFQLWINTVEQQQYLVNDLILPFTNHTDSEFEGIVLGHKLVKNKPMGPAFLIETDRNEAIIPGNTTYIVQAYDSYFISTEEITHEKYEFDLISVINNVKTVDDSIAIWGKNIDLEGYLHDEFGNAINGKDVTIQYQVGSIWYNYFEISGDNVLTTDADGRFSGIFDSTKINKSDSINIKLSWVGDSDHLQVSEEFKIDLLEYTNSIIISIVNSTDQPHFERGRTNKISIRVSNDGNSTLKSLNFTLSVEGAVGGENDLNNLNNLISKELSPYEICILEYYINIPNGISGENFTIVLNVFGESLESDEEIDQNVSFTMDLIDPPTLNNLDQLLIILYIFSAIAIWLVSIIYIKNTHEKLQEVPEIEEKKTKKGRYVNVSELSTKKRESDKNKEKSKKKEARSADLDDLLKEEGLDDKTDSSES